MSWTEKCRKRGAVLLWTVLLALGLVAMVGLVIDIAWVLWVAHQLQNTADAAALSGALVVREDLAAAHDQPVAVAYANKAAGDPVQLVPNPGNLPEGDVVIGGYLYTTRDFVPTLIEPNAVKVVARRTADSPGGPVPLFFGPIFGVETVDITRSAIAMTGGGKNIGLIVLDPSAPQALRVGGDSILNVDRRGVQVNSTAPNAGFSVGSTEIWSTDLCITGGSAISKSTVVTGELRTGTRPMPDPLQYVKPPDLKYPEWYADAVANDYGTAFCNTGDNITISPGYYSGGIDMQGGNLTLEPGVYVLDGKGIYMRGNGNFYADGVMLYITGTGCVDMAGNGEIYLAPLDRARTDYNPAPLPPGCQYYYEGISIFQDRNSTVPSEIIGTALMDLNGTLYFPSVLVDMGGTGGSFGNSMICNEAEIWGTSDITIDYDSRFPAPGGGCYLVE